MREEHASKGEGGRTLESSVQRPIMNIYREPAPDETDLEIDAIRDLLERIQRLRRRIALPSLVVVFVSMWMGTLAHCTGYWAPFGVSANHTYSVNVVTLVIVAAVSGAPFAAFGFAVYAFARDRLRRAWHADHRSKGLDDAWLDESARRFL